MFFKRYKEHCGVHDNLAANTNTNVAFTYSRMCKPTVQMFYFALIYSQFMFFVFYFLFTVFSYHPYCAARQEGKIDISLFLFALATITRGT